MTIAEGFAAEFELEAATTRRFLERFEDSRAGWKPHDRSMSLGRLATHVVEMPDWANTILGAEHFDFATAGYRPPAWNTRAELLEAHERVAAGFLGQLEGLSDAHMQETWQLRQGGRVLRQSSRATAIRGFVLSHVVHHRGQLSVYYRLLGIPVPGAYGPSADDREASSAA